MLVITIPGKPIAQARPRFRSNGIVYDRQHREKDAVKLLIKSQIGKERVLRPIESIIFVTLTFHTPIPDSWSYKSKKAVLGHPDGRRPDIDNYAKFYCDAMNSIIYKDDNQIAELWCRKRYSDNPRVEILIKEIE